MPMHRTALHYKKLRTTNYELQMTIRSTVCSNLIAIDKWESQGKRFQYRGHDIFLAKSAASETSQPLETLLLIHGFPTASWDFSALWQTLAKKFHLLAPDLIGFGFSAKPPEYDYSIHDQVDLCEAVLQQAGISEYHILAHDYGDTVAQELLARSMEKKTGPRLKSVCFLNGGLFPETHRPLMVQRLLLSPLGGIVARMMTPEKFASNMRAIAGPEHQPEPYVTDGFWQLITRNDGAKIFPRLIRYMRERRRHRARWVGALVNASIPLRLINGAADPVSGEHAAARYCELVPRADCILLNGIGHYPHVEVPSQVAELFLNFHDTRVTNFNKPAAKARA